MTFTEKKEDLWKRRENIRKIQMAINSDYEKIAVLKSCMTGIKSFDYSAVRVQASPDQDFMGKTAVMVEELYEDIEKLNGRLAIVCTEMISEFSSIPDEEQERVMTLFYLQRRSNSEVAEMMHMSERNVRRFKNKGIGELCRKKTG
ncbi:MAG: sigma factor-like helix-turn-helix DNA-binding protein [Eubacteriales bacterium]|nr:sigma factor-like helix-turn-helix DNA-binding protein [Eubacteriales bacterium]